MRARQAQDNDPRTKEVLFGRAAKQRCMCNQGNTLEQCRNSRQQDPRVDNRDRISEKSGCLERQHRG